MDMLTVSGISKRFGTNQIIDNLSFSVKEHTIYGFIGQNGAGKTTTMKMILGLLPTDQGEITVNGEKVKYGQNSTNRYIGYLPDVPEFYTFLTPVEYLKLCGNITGMEEKQIKKRAGELLELVGLSEKANKRIHGFSRGMKQRLGIAQAMLNNPKLLICDEPTSALDPLGRKEILDILLQVKEHTTVIFSTHILSDVERICDEVGLLHKGKLAVGGTIEEIRKRHQEDEFEVEFRTSLQMQEFSGKMPGGIPVGNTVLRYSGKSEQKMKQVFGLLAETGILPVRVEMREPTLENLFMEVIGE